MLFIQLKGYNANVLPATSAGAPVIGWMMWYRGK
jgi:hypothetical protein